MGEDPFERRLWHELRQGARNVAGVRYQLGVTAYVTALSRAGALKFVEFTPEGLEDIDCRDHDGAQWHVQVKEIGAGAGSFPIGRMVDVLDHAARATASDSRIVAVTDGVPGKGLVETGWQRTVAAVEGINLGGLLYSLGERGWAESDALSLLARSHLVRIDWNVAGPTIKALAEAFELPRAVASVIYRTLVDDLSEIAASQRSTSEAQAAHRRVGDLDVLVHRVLEIVDQAALDEATIRGVCEPADYVARPGFARREFLEGIDASPAHVGASFDVLRPRAIRDVQRAIERRRYALITGPSGSGKSAQAWRSARDVATGARVVRVTRIANDDDLSLLLRHVRLLDPTEHSPVVVVADDLGRPQTRHWPMAARRLLEFSDVLLIGAVRQEDLSADMIRHGGELVILELDDDSARVIAEQLVFEGVELQLEVKDAIAQADGLLMEYIALLTTGRRLREVLGGQAEDLLRADQVSVEAARLICTAHTLGVSIAAGELSEELQAETTAVLSTALRRLRDEHIVTTPDQRAWRGLHEARSLVLMGLLHNDPPPTLDVTVSRVVAMLDPLAQGWTIRRAIEQHPSVELDPRTIARNAVDRCRSAQDFAQLFESFERADNSITARAYLPVLEQHRRPPTTTISWAMLVLAHKFADVSFGDVAVFAKPARRIAACAAELGDRSNALCGAAAQLMTSQQLIDAAIDASLSDAVRLLDAVSTYVSLAGIDLARLAARFERPNVILSREERQLFGRLMLSASVAAESPAAYAATFGSVTQRASWGSSVHPDVIALEVDVDARTATVEVLTNHGTGSGLSRLPWDAERARSDTSDEANDRAVELANFVGECCPELELVEVRTLTPGRQPYQIGGLEPGHKRLGRNARRPKHETRVMQGLLAAIGRQKAANSWTTLVRLRAAAASDVLAASAEIGRRLNPNDHPRRHCQWRDDLKQLDERLADLPQPPVKSQLTRGSLAMTWDMETTEDGLVKVLREIVSALQQLVPERGDHIVAVGVADQLGQAADRLAVLAESETPLLATGELDTYRDLIRELRRGKGLLLAISFDGSATHRIGGRPGEFEAVMDQLIEKAAEAQVTADRSSVEMLFAGVPDVEVRIVSDEKPFVTSIRGHQVVVTATPDTWLTAFETLACIGQRGEAPTDVPLSLVCVDSGVILPFGARLTTMFSIGALPLPDEAIEALSRALGLPVLSGCAQSAVLQVLERLTSASHAIARSRMRPVGWPTASTDIEEIIWETENLILTDPLPAAVAEPLRRLVEQVRIEARAETDTYLADEMTGLRLLDGDLDESSQVWGDVIEAHLASIEFSLSSHRTRKTGE